MATVQQSSIGDAATKAGDAGEVVKHVSTPSEPDRSPPRTIAGGAVSGVGSATGSDALGAAGRDDGSPP